jgi:hypothetical protein
MRVFSVILSPFPFRSRLSFRARAVRASSWSGRSLHSLRT